MTTTNLFSLALQAYRELQPELEQAGQPIHTPALPSLAEAVAQVQDLPRGALMLGVAADGLPVLLDLYDPAPCPLLIVGDGRSGKTSLLQLLARSVDLLQEPGDVQFGVVTNFPDEWKDIETSSSSMGIWPAYHSSALQFIRELVDWADGSTAGREVRMLLLDDLSALANSDAESQEALRWLLVRGPERRVWTSATLNALRALRLRPWLRYFPTHLFGFVHQPAVAETLTGDLRAGLGSLIPGVQFSLKQDTGWLQFWLPAVE